MGRFIAITLPKFNSDGLVKRVVKELDRRGKKNEGLLLKTTINFTNVKPTFDSTVERSGSDWQVITAPLNDESGRIWSWLDQGTSIRYAWMSDDYVQVTQPGTSVTQEGDGNKVFVSTRHPADEQGIEPRGWTELLIEEELDLFGQDMVKTVSKFVQEWYDKSSKIISGI